MAGVDFGLNQADFLVRAGEGRQEAGGGGGDSGGASGQDDVRYL